MTYLQAVDLLALVAILLGLRALHMAIKRTY